MNVSDSSLVRRSDGTARIVATSEVAPSDRVIRNDQMPCRVSTHESGLYTFELGSSADANATIFERDDPAEYERALQEALPALYQSFAPTGWQGTTLGPIRD